MSSYSGHMLHAASHKLLSISNDLCSTYSFSNFQIASFSNYSATTCPSYSKFTLSYLVQPRVGKISL
jgi:hypothetical protein